MKSIVALFAIVLLVAGCGMGSKSTDGGADAAKSGLSVTATFRPDPPTQGSQMLTIAVKDASGAPVRGALVKVTSAMPSMSMGGPNAVGTDSGDGTYTARLVLKFATTWTFDIIATAEGKTGRTVVSKDVK